MIDLADNHLKAVKRILNDRVPGREVRAFGSRVTGNAKPYSDLDLAIIADEPLDFDTFRLLQEAFETSDLPFRVDVLDWNGISKSFRQVIEKKYVVLQSDGGR
jgi:uncharacterized protein